MAHRSGALIIVSATGLTARPLVGTADPTELANQDLPRIPRIMGASAAYNLPMPSTACSMALGQVVSSAQPPGVEALTSEPLRIDQVAHVDLIRVPLLQVVQIDQEQSQCGQTLLSVDHIPFAALMAQYHRADWWRECPGS